MLVVIFFSYKGVHFSVLLYSYIQAMQCAELFSSEGFMKKHGASCQPKGTNLITLLSLYNMYKQKSGDSVLWYHNHSLHKSFSFSDQPNWDIWPWRSHKHSCSSSRHCGHKKCPFRGTGGVRLWRRFVNLKKMFKARLMIPPKQCKNHMLCNSCLGSHLPSLS